MFSFFFGRGIGVPAPAASEEGGGAGVACLVVVVSARGSAAGDVPEGEVNGAPWVATPGPEHDPMTRIAAPVPAMTAPVEYRFMAKKLVDNSG